MRRRNPAGLCRVMVGAAGPVTLALPLLLAGHSAGAQNRFVQTNLVSDVPGVARVLDPQLKNPWGISLSAGSPFWVSDNGAGVSTLYTSLGTKLGFVVTIPGPGGSVMAAPTGQVFNNTGSFALPAGGNAIFLFADEGGTISAWNPAGGTHAVTVVNGSGTGASYKGLAIAGRGPSARLYAANFGNGRVDVFDGSFTRISGGFVDPTIPAGYAPFNVRYLGGSVYVTYALRNPLTGDDVAGPGHGMVDVFDTDGVFQRRLTTGGALNSPWGLALAPAGFGSFGGDLLVGNFGDGRISAFDPATGAFLGQLLDRSGAPVVNDGLWGLTFGNGGPGGDPKTLYFAAGIDDEAHGLFGSLSVVPEPATLALVAAGLGTMTVGAARVRRRMPPHT